MDIQLRDKELTVFFDDDETINNIKVENDTNMTITILPPNTLSITLGARSHVNIPIEREE